MRGRGGSSGPQAALRVAAPGVGKRPRGRSGDGQAERRTHVYEKLWVRLKAVLSAAGHAAVVSDATSRAERARVEKRRKKRSKRDEVRYGLAAVFGKRFTEEGGDWHDANICRTTDPESGTTDPRYALLWGRILGALSGGRTTALPKGGVDALFTTGAPTRADGHNTRPYRLADFWSAERGLDPESLQTRLQSLPLPLGEPPLPAAHPAASARYRAPLESEPSLVLTHVNDDTHADEEKDDAGSQPLLDPIAELDDFDLDIDDADTDCLSDVVVPSTPRFGAVELLDPKDFNLLNDLRDELPEGLCETVENYIAANNDVYYHSIAQPVDLSDELDYLAPAFSEMASVLLLA